MRKASLTVGSNALGRSSKRLAVRQSIGGGSRTVGTFANAMMSVLAAIAAEMSLSKHPLHSGDKAGSTDGHAQPGADLGSSSLAETAVEGGNAPLDHAHSAVPLDLDSGVGIGSIPTGTTGDLDMNLPQFSAAASLVLAGFVTSTQPADPSGSAHELPIAAASFDFTAAAEVSPAGGGQTSLGLVGSMSGDWTASAEVEVPFSGTGATVTSARIAATHPAVAADAAGDVAQAPGVDGSPAANAPHSADIGETAVATAGNGTGTDDGGPLYAMGSVPDSAGAASSPGPAAYASASASAETVIAVSTAAELMDALRHATGGETILLAPGEYGELNLYGPRDKFANYASNVTIRSASSGDMAVFNIVKLTQVSNITLENVIFDYKSTASSPEYTQECSVTDSKNISIKNSIFDGDLGKADGVGSGYGTGIGLAVRNSTNINVEGNEFYDFFRGASFGIVSGLKVSSNNIHDIRSDGFNFVVVNDVLIEENYFHDFRKSPQSGDHMDMIQFWTTGADKPSTDIVIRSNIMDSASGDQTQSIFMRNEAVDSAGAGLEMFYKNILIENNLIYNAHTHGITVGQSLGLIIRNNTILHNPDSGSGDVVYVPTINLVDASTDVVVENNIVPRLSLTETLERIVRNNLVVQENDPLGNAYVGDLFADALAGSHATLEDLKAVLGGLIEQLGVGSSLTRFDGTPDVPTGYILDEEAPGLQRLTHSLDATNLFGPEGRLNLAGATAVWTFGDGQTAQGLQVTHSFDNAAERVVGVTVTLADGSRIQLDKTIVVESPVALELSFDRSTADLSDQVNTMTAAGSQTFEDGVRGQAIRLNGGALTYDAGSDFLNNREYTVQFDIKEEPGSAGGYVAYFPYSFNVNAGPSRLEANITIGGVGYTVRATGLTLADSQWHRVALTFSGEDGAAVLYLDGKSVGRLDGLAGGVQVGSTAHDLSIGSPFGSSFTGLIDNFSFLRGAMDADMVRDAYFEMKEALGPTSDEIMHAGTPGEAGYTSHAHVGQSDWLH